MPNCRFCLYASHCDCDSPCEYYTPSDTEMSDLVLGNYIEENRAAFHKEFFEYIDAFYFD